MTPKEQVTLLLRARSVRIAQQERYIRYLEAALKAARERIAALEARCEQIS